MGPRRARECFSSFKKYFSLYVGIKPSVLCSIIIRLWDFKGTLEMRAVSQKSNLNLTDVMNSCTVGLNYDYLVALKYAKAKNR